MTKNLLALGAALTVLALVSIVPAQQASAPAQTVVLAGDHRVGAGRSFDQLTVFPILAADQPDLGTFVTLEQALRDKTAEVRETSAGGTVGSVVIENKGRAPIFVLAGTVVKGGKQDRQIAQDFAVGTGAKAAKKGHTISADFVSKQP